MVGKIFSRSKKLIFSPQSSVLSAATIIMLMIVASRILGLVRQRTLAHFFAPGELSLFFAAFRLPDLVFEILVFGTFSSAFIPVFTKTFQKKEAEAWEIAGNVVNIGLLIFGLLGFIAGLAADRLYGFFAPGFSPVERAQIVKIARLLFMAQGFFVVSYVLTGVLESLRRFLVPALAPLFYNLGIIFGIVLWANKMGLMAPAIGVFVGAFFHLIIQLPLALRLGFRFRPSIRFTQGVKKIGQLAAPRVFELSFLQVGKTVELFLASLISTAAYTYYTFGNSLQLLPVGLFGTSIAKAALPTLAAQSDSKEKFRNTLFNALYQIVFLVSPIATILIILRVPLVRLAFGTKVFDWQATVQTGFVVSAFALGIVFQSAAAVLVRAFYALHDTRTPVKVSIIGILITVVADLVFIKVLFLPAWGLAAAFSLGAAFQATTLFYLINKRINKVSLLAAIRPMLKPVVSSFGAGMVMFVLLKVFDRSVWVKRLSFLGKIEAASFLPFEKFVLDTRYTINLLILTAIVSLVGLLVYMGLAVLLKTKEVWIFFNLVKRTLIKRKVAPIPTKEAEPITPTPTETTSS
jgi:putative peptidoglycan lipid II flippase